MFRYVAVGALAAFVAIGPLQHVGVLPETAAGDLSKQAIKSVLGLTAKDAFAGCKGSGGLGGGNGGGKGGGKGKGGKHANNGFGNGGMDGVPGKSKKEDRDR